jgi:hypothetical protein
MVHKILRLKWFNSGNIKGGDFVIHELWYKFCTSNSASVFFNKNYGSQFQSKGAIRKDFKLGLALVNKKRICTRLINKKLEKIAPTFSRTWSSITSEHDIGEDFEEVVSND